ncbi:hypothetical protein HLB03_02280, partial [Acidianus sp. DSM 29099]|nr:hypothetical protein [Acidianus sp. RZ1]
IDFSSEGEVSSPGTISGYYYNEYFVNVEFPIQAYVNGTQMNLNSGWYIQGTNIQIINNSILLGQGIREVITSVSPAIDFIVNSPVTVTIKLLPQYFITFNSPIPVKALVNGTFEEVETGWFNNNTVIQIENYTYYVNNLERYVPMSIFPSTLVVDKPTTVTVNAI